MKLLFIRHTSVDVPKGICYGQSDVNLSPTFPQEAADVKHRLSRYNIAAAYTSPLSRCVKLAAACGFPDAIKDNRLMEMNFGDWEMQRYDEIADPRLQTWFDDYVNVKATAGESFMDQRHRFQSFLSSLPCDNSTIAIFSHAGILIQAMTVILGYSIDQAFNAQPTYGSIIEVAI